MELALTIIGNQTSYKIQKLNKMELCIKLKWNQMSKLRLK